MFQNTEMIVNASFYLDRRRRQSLRLRNYQYSREGAYFITACTFRRELLFGEVIDAQTQLNDLGLIVAEEWLRSSQVRIEVQLDAWIVMPNHIHGIVILTGERKGTEVPVAPGGPHARSLGALMAGFKSSVTKRINSFRGTPGAAVWQRSYYDHVIRNESSLNRIRQYIAENPVRWPEDPENPFVVEC